MKLKNTRLGELMRFIGNLSKDDIHYYHIAMASFFGEALFPGEFDMDEHRLDIKEFEKSVGSEIFNNLNPCALEFFFSNEYPVGSKGKMWNVLDVFLKEKGASLPKEDKDYWQGLRDSYMGIYEVTNIVLDESITLRSIIKHDPGEVTVKEKKATHGLAIWDTIGARVVTTPEGNYLSGGALLLSTDTASAVKEQIELISNVMLSKEFLEQLRSETTDPKLAVKKMWVKEIAYGWFQEATQKPSPLQLFNKDHDKLQFCTLEFPIVGPKKDVVKILDNLPELSSFHLENVKDVWVWPVQQESAPRKKKGSDSDDAHYFETLIQDHQGKSFSVYAEAKIKRKKLIIDVNSVQRANITEDYFKSHLKNKIGGAVVIKHDLNKLPAHLADKKAPQLDISPEEEAKLIKNFYDDHYARWIDLPLPALDDQSPRQASKSKKGRQKLIPLLKHMENSENKKPKADRQDYRYDFTWMFGELGIRKEEM
jgi:hypothetical protein